VLIVRSAIPPHGLNAREIQRDRNVTYIYVDRVLLGPETAHFPGLPITKVMV